MQHDRARAWASESACISEREREREREINGPLVWMNEFQYMQLTEVIRRQQQKKKTKRNEQKKKTKQKVNRTNVELSAQAVIRVVCERASTPATATAHKNAQQQPQPSKTQTKIKNLLKEIKSVQTARREAKDQLSDSLSPLSMLALSRSLVRSLTRAVSSSANARQHARLVWRRRRQCFVFAANRQTSCAWLQYIYKNFLLYLFVFVFVFSGLSTLRLVHCCSVINWIRDWQRRLCVCRRQCPSVCLLFVCGLTVDWVVTVTEFLSSSSNQLRTANCESRNTNHNSHSNSNNTQRNSYKAKLHFIYKQQQTTNARSSINLTANKTQIFLSNFFFLDNKSETSKNTQ